MSIKPRPEVKICQSRRKNSQAPDNCLSYPCLTRTAVPLGYMLKCEIRCNDRDLVIAVPSQTAVIPLGQCASCPRNRAARTLLVLAVSTSPWTVCWVIEVITSAAPPEATHRTGDDPILTFRENAWTVG